MCCYAACFLLKDQQPLVIVPSKFFHDRYFFTEYGALKSGQGFIIGAALGAQADKLSINLCGKNDRCKRPAITG